MSTPYPVNVDGRPPPGLGVRHDGAPINPTDDDYFALPPPEIGEIYSGTTNLKHGARPNPTWLRYLAMFIGIAVGLGGCGKLMGTFDALGNGVIDFWKIALPIAAALVGFAIGYFSTLFLHRCNYAGAEGFADYTCQGTRDQVMGTFHAFADGKALFAGETKVFKNGSYQETKFEWTLEKKSGLGLVFLGSYNENEPARPDDYHAGQALERAWTRYLAARVPLSMQIAGCVEFPTRFGLGGVKSIALSPGCIEIRTKEGNVRCTPDELASVTLQAGKLCFTRKDAKKGWFSSSGTFETSYSDLGNGKLFFILLDTLVGYRFG